MATALHAAFAAFALLVVGLLLLGGALVLYVSLLSRRTAAAAKLLTSLGARAKSVHRRTRRPASATTTAGLTAIGARDPGFDPQMLLDASTRLLYLHASVLDNGDDSVLDAIVDDRFWFGDYGRQLRYVATARRQADERADRVMRKAAGAVPLPGWRRGTIDVAVRDCEVVAAEADRAVDRVRVRVGWSSSQGMVGIAAGRRAAGMAGDLRAGTQPFTTEDLTRTEGATLTTTGAADWEFERPAGAQTLATEALLHPTCVTCGSPYRGDLDTACPACRTPRRLPVDDWHLTRAWWVVDGPGPASRLGRPT
jgi:hypothetical protein